MPARELRRVVDIMALLGRFLPPRWVYQSIVPHRLLPVVAGNYYQMSQVLWASSESPPQKRPRPVRLLKQP